MSIYHDSFFHFSGYLLSLTAHNLEIEIRILEHASIPILALSKEAIFKENSRVGAEQ